MTKRYYYDCPLASCIMAKEFGMYIGLEDFSAPEFKIWYSNDYNTILEGWNKKAGEIHIDSLSILKPQVGDAGMGIKDKSLLCIFGKTGTTYYPDSPFSNKWCRGGVLYKPHEAITIFRDDKPFFWPLVEEVEDGLYNY
jgi:hypothetical protein